MARGCGTGSGIHWWHHGHGYCAPGYPAEYAPDKELPMDAAHLGPCRCGLGPHAYYRSADGRIFYAAPLSYSEDVAPPDPAATYKGLQREVERLSNRVQELESELMETAEARGARSRSGRRTKEDV